MDGNSIPNAVAGLFFASFLLLWLSFASFIAVALFRFYRRQDKPGYWQSTYFGTAKAREEIYRNANQRFLVLLEEVSKYFSSRFGRIHSYALGTFLLMTIAIGIWLAVIEARGAS